LCRSFGRLLLRKLTGDLAPLRFFNALTLFFLRPTTGFLSGLPLECFFCLASLGIFGGAKRFALLLFFLLLLLLAIFLRLGLAGLPGGVALGIHLRCFVQYGRRRLIYP
jgi:hypothetical protein